MLMWVGLCLFCLKMFNVKLLSGFSCVDPGEGLVILEFQAATFLFSGHGSKIVAHNCK